MEATATEHRTYWCSNCERVRSIHMGDLITIDTDEGTIAYHHTGDYTSDGDPVPCGPMREVDVVAAAGGDARLVIDLATGEIIADLEPRFRVRDRDTAEWVLRHIFEAEAEASAHRRRLETLIENVERMVRAAEREAEWFRSRFGDELEWWARDEVEGSGRKSLDTPWGRVGFRHAPGRTIVRNHEEAAASMGDDHPAVKVTRKVLVSVLEEEDRHALERLGLAESDPSGDRFYIRTGVDQ